MQWVSNINKAVAASLVLVMALTLSGRPSFAAEEDSHGSGVIAPGISKDDVANTVDSSWDDNWKIWNALSNPFTFMLYAGWTMNAFYGLKFINSVATPEELLVRRDRKKLLETELEDKLIQYRLRELEAQSPGFVDRLSNLRHEIDFRNKTIDGLEKELARITNHAHTTGQKNPMEPHLRNTIAQQKQALVKLEAENGRIKRLIEDEPTGFFKARNHINALEKLDKAMDTLMKEAVDQSNRFGSSSVNDRAALFEGVNAWNRGEGLRKFSTWLNSTSGQKFLKAQTMTYRDGRTETRRNAEGKTWKERYDSTIQQAEEHARKVVSIYNPVAEKHNLHYPDKKVDFLEVLDGNHGTNFKRFALVSEISDTPQKKMVAEKLGRGNGEIELTKTINLGQVLPQFNLACDEALKAMYDEAVHLDKLARQTWYRNPLIHASLMGAGMGITGAANIWYHSTHGKSLADARTEIKDKDDELRNAAKELPGLLEKEEQGLNRFGPFYKIATDLIREHRTEIVDNIKDRFKGRDNEKKKLKQIHSDAQNFNPPPVDADGKPIGKDIVKDSVKNALYEQFKTQKSVEGIIAAIYSKNLGDQSSTLPTYLKQFYYKALSSLFPLIYNPQNGGLPIDDDIINDLVLETIERLQPHDNVQVIPGPTIPGFKAPDQTPVKKAVDLTAPKDTTSDATPPASQPTADAPLLPPAPGTPVSLDSNATPSVNASAFISPPTASEQFRSSMGDVPIGVVQPLAPKFAGSSQ